MSSERMSSEPAAPGSTQRGIAPRPALYLTCDAATGPAAGICDQTRAALALAAPGYRVVQVSRTLATRTPAVRLEILQMDAQGLSARLLWRQAETSQAGTWQQGPDLALDVQDAPLRADMLESFLADLIRVTALPFSA